MISAMYETIKRLYNQGRLTDIGVNNAVTKEWIKSRERDEILGIEQTVEDEEPTK